MALVHLYHISPKDAWDMTMAEYALLSGIEKKQPVNPVYDKEEQERIIAKNELLKLEKNG